jgi:predicted outer membrane protein
MPSARWSILFLAGATVFAQTPDTGTAQKAAATALLNSNNTDAAHLAATKSVSDALRMII